MKKKFVQVSVLFSSISLATLFLLVSMGACNINLFNNKVELNKTTSAAENLIVIKEDGKEIILKDTTSNKYYTNIYEESNKVRMSSSKSAVFLEDFTEVKIDGVTFYETDYLEPVDDLLIVKPEKIDPKDVEVTYDEDGQIMKKHKKTGVVYYNEKAKNLMFASSKVRILFETVVINDTIYYQRKR